MNENDKAIFETVGGIAMFFYGIYSMNDALQKSTVEKMKNALSFLTKNLIMGALAGALVTAVLYQSELQRDRQRGKSLCLRRFHSTV